MNRTTACLLMLLLFTSVSVQLLFGPSSPYETALAYKNLPPSWDHFFGTDELGRDLYARVCQGCMISCCIGAVAFGIDITIGVIWGTLSALFSPSLISHTMHRISEVVYSIPTLLIVLLIALFSGTGLIPLIAALLAMGWIQTARVTEILTKDALSSEYVLSARVLGIPSFRIVVRHILPNIRPALLASGLMAIPQAIFSEAFLSFLGVGIQPPTASLGSLISDALPSLRLYPWRLLIPSALLSLMILCVTCIADSMRARDERRRSHVE